VLDTLGRFYQEFIYRHVQTEPPVAETATVHPSDLETIYTLDKLLNEFLLPL
jgi:hypothetical protein